MREIFMSVAAAEGNIGDIFIRRQALRALVSVDSSSATVYSGSMGQSYLQAFGFDSGWSVTSSPRVFLSRLTKAMVARRAVLVMAPGPAMLGGSVMSSFKHLGVGLMFAGARLLGCRVLVLGRSVRGGGRIGRLSERLILRSSHMYVSRDRTTAELLGPEVIVAPDLAFAHQPGLDSLAERSRVVISLRHDRDVDLLALKALVEGLRSNRLVPVFVTQVREDGEQHSRLSSELGVEHFDWPPSRSHHNHEVALSDFYQGCVAAVSDRLHVLILAARGGAIPVVVESVNEQKLHASLDEWLSPLSISLAAGGGALSLEPDSDEVVRLELAMGNASLRLDQVFGEVSSLIR